MLILFSSIIFLAGYSLASVGALRLKHQPAAPDFWDNLLVVSAIAANMLYLSSTVVSVRIFPVVFLASGFIGFLRHAIPSSSGRIVAGTGEFPPVQRPEPPDHMRSALVRYWTAWKTFAAECGDFQARIAISVVYFGLLWPFAFFASRRDPLELRAVNSHSYWKKRAPVGETMQDAKRQF